MYLEKLIILILMFLFGCGAEPDKYMNPDMKKIAYRNMPRKFINPDFKPLIDHYFDVFHAAGLPSRGDMSKIRNIDFTPSGELLKDGFQGVCKFYEVKIGLTVKDVRVIQIDAFLKDEPKTTLYAVVYHELTHCVWNVKGHSDKPNHLMEKEMSPDRYVAEHLEEMLTETANDVATGAYSD